MFWKTMPICVERTARRSARAELVDVAAADEDLAGGRLDQPVEVADQRRLAGAAQAHDAEDLARPHREGDVGHADDAAVALADLVLARAAPGGGERGGFVGAEDLPEMPAVDGGVGHGLGLLPAWRPRPPYWAALASAIHSSHSVWCAAIQSVACFLIASSEFSP